MKRDPYTVITKEIVSFKGNSKLSDIYNFACLYSTVDYKTGISKYNQETIKKKFGIPESTFRETINRLSTYKIIEINRKEYHPNNKIIRKNYYKIDTEPNNYFFILNDFFSVDSSRELKGFLLLLKALCLNSTNTYIAERVYKGEANKTELSERMGISRKTAVKYLEEAIKRKFITIEGAKIIIANENFRLNVSNNNRLSEIKGIIHEFCFKYQSNIPTISDKEINKILLRYPHTESEIKQINDMKFTERYSIKYIFDKRINKLPKELNIRYLFRILNITYQKDKEVINKETLVIK